MAIDLTTDDHDCVRKDYTARVGAPINPDSEVDVECFMTTTTVDADGEVVLPGGIDLSRFNKNPVVMLCHSLGQPNTYPFPVGKALWTKQVKNGVMAGVRFSRDTEMGRQVKALFDEGMLSAFSVGFRPIEASQMTRKEAESRPDWAEAYAQSKGHIRVHRKWLLVELSVVPVPNNPDSLVTSFAAKGMAIPAWLNLKGTSMADNEMEDKAACTCKDGDEEKCAKCQAEMEVKDAEDGDGDEYLEAKAMEDADDDFDEDDESSLPIKTRDHVDIRGKGFRGCGVVEKIHRKGMVDHVDEDIVGTKDDPAARVRIYKAHGDGHAPTERRMGAKLSQLTRREVPLTAPTKKAFTEAETKALPNSPVGEKPEPLPPLVAMSEAEAQKAAIEQATMAAVEQVNKLFGVV